MREFWSQYHKERKFAVFFVGLALLTLIGPFGTYGSLDIWQRLVFWTVIFAGVGALMHMCVTTALATHRLNGLSQYLRIAIGVGFATLPGAAVVIFTDAVMRPPIMATEHFPLICMQVFLIGMFVSVVEYSDLIGAPPKPQTETTAANAPLAPTPAAAPVLSPFHRRLPPELGTDIISISMQDHYAAVTTTQGTHMVLMRFGDVLTELDGWPGVQTHRSHWVALKHLKGKRREGGKPKAELSDGRSLPVSATFSANVDRALKEHLRTVA